MHLGQSQWLSANHSKLPSSDWLPWMTFFDFWKSKVMVHDQMPPSVSGVAAPAFFNKRGIIPVRDHLMSFQYPAPEFLFHVRGRGLMTQVTVSFLSRGMAEARYFPGSNAVACPAVIPESALMDLKMTFGAGKIRVEKSVINLGNVSRSATVLGMTPKAVFMHFMEAQFRLKRRDVREKMALQACVVTHSLPGDVAGFTV